MSSSLKQTLKQESFVDNPPKTHSTQTQNQGKQTFHHTGNNIDSVVRPILEQVETKIQTQYQTLHNQYLLQSYQRKVKCFQKYLLPPSVVTPKIQETKNKQKNKKPLVAETVSSPKQQSHKATSDDVLQYYKCFDEQKNLSIYRYQKLYKKSEDNKMKLVNCVERCSANSKQQNQLFEACTEKCQQTYSEVLTKLYSNFYNKFIDKN